MKLKRAFRYTAAFVAAVLASSLLSSVFSTQFVIAGLESINVEIPLGTRVTMTLEDLAIVKALSAVIAASFLVAAACNRWAGGNRTAWYGFAGASALVTTLVLMSWQMQLVPIAGARTIFGLITQSLAGATGGVLFSRLTKKLKYT